ncbi:MAG TPA: N-acetyl-gamma-glutamyl-phosphate reductase [Caulobacteraceae bacterium]|nr:N-acetyl-gamma-glutamyl-phosphate reductase [Caulobacteraceae bacterium]
MTTVFIDGAAGTTGLEIRERLAGHAGLTLVALEGDKRKDPKARREALNDADVVILCLPDDAAREAVALIDNPKVKVIDASTAHRTAAGWTYGFAELDPGQRAAIAASKRVSNPGCYPTGFLALMRPLTRAGLIPEGFPVTVNAVSGYSGGGKAMIAEFEDEASPHFSTEVFRTYGLTLQHKHVGEMQIHAHLTHPPIFAPSVGRFYRGMLVETPLNLWALKGHPSVHDVHQVLAKAYCREPLVEVASLEDGHTSLDAEILKGSDRLKLFVFGNEQRGQARLIAALDNLGKGAGGAAVQNLNLLTGRPETEGLVL